MNIKYKISKTFFFQLFFINVIFGQNAITIGNRSFPQISTISGLKMMAKKYGLEDLISENYNAHLQYETKEDAEKFFFEQSEALESRKETLSYLERTKFVKEPEDYFKLIDSLPRFKKSMIQGYKNDGWECFKENLLTNNQRIYRSSNGGLTFIPDTFIKNAWEKETDDVRLDILPRK